MSHSITGWSISRRPNYDLNIDKLYPYSEVPYIGQYHLVKIPLNEDLIEHVDYWGEGRIDAYGLITGYIDCYNVNHHFQLVSNGPDTDRKIPNRIPVINYTNCDTSSYIKDNSVKLVTLMGAPINKSCARDIARMVNLENGKVVVYGFKADAKDIKNLEKELAIKAILFSPNHEIDGKLLEVTMDHRAYLNLTELSQDLYKSVTESKLDDAVTVSKAMNDIKKGNMIVNLVTRLIQEKQKNVISFAYKLWNGDEKQIVENYFPGSIKLMFNGDIVKIIFKKTLSPLKLTGNFETNGKEDQWKIVPEFGGTQLYFKFQTNGNNLFMSLEKNGEDITLKEVENGTDAETHWSLEPFKNDEEVLYLIINRQNSKALIFKNIGDEKQTLTSESVKYDLSHEFAWLIMPYNSSYEYYTKKAKDRRK